MSRVSYMSGKTIHFQLGTGEEGTVLAVVGNVGAGVRDYALGVTERALIGKVSARIERANQSPSGSISEWASLSESRNNPPQIVSACPKPRR
jgi:hypothetical protein